MKQAVVSHRRQVVSKSKPGLPRAQNSVAKIAMARTLGNLEHISGSLVEKAGSQLSRKVLNNCFGRIKERQTALFG